MLRVLTMDDRELLKRAAKAAGYWSNEYGCVDKLPRPGWDPLTDDGDALRLAVVLQMELKVYDTSAHAASAIGGRSVCASVKGEPTAATRRAIVRAAVALADPEPT